MTGKIDRLATGARLQAVPDAKPEVKAAEVAAPVPVATPVAAPQNTWTQQGLATLAAASAGPHVALSAKPDALWGSAPAARPDDPVSLAALPPEQRAAKLEAMQAQRDELKERIGDRVAVLDKKWNHSRVSTRSEALREYADRSQHLDPETRQHLESHVDRAEDAQRRINRIQAKVERLGPARTADPATKAQRAELVKALKAARSEQSAAVKDATKVVDAAGLKVDRLATTEEVIDPSAPPPSSPDSLLGMVTSFFHLDWLCTWFQGLVSGPQTFTKGLKKERNADEQRYLQDLKAQQQLANNRRLLDELSVASTGLKRH